MATTTGARRHNLLDLKWAVTVCKPSAVCLSTRHASFRPFQNRRTALPAPLKQSSKHGDRNPTITCSPLNQHRRKGSYTLSRTSVLLCKPHFSRHRSTPPDLHLDIPQRRATTRRRARRTPSPARRRPGARARARPSPPATARRSRPRRPCTQDGRRTWCPDPARPRRTTSWRGTCSPRAAARTSGTPAPGHRPPPPPPPGEAGTRTIDRRAAGLGDHHRRPAVARPAAPRRSRPDHGHRVAAVATVHHGARHRGCAGPVARRDSPASPRARAQRVAVPVARREHHGAPPPAP